MLYRATQCHTYFGSLFFSYTSGIISWTPFRAISGKSSAEITHTKQTPEIQWIRVWLCEGSHLNHTIMNQRVVLNYLNDKWRGKYDHTWNTNTVCNENNNNWACLSLTLRGAGGVQTKEGAPDDLWVLFKSGNYVTHHIHELGFFHCVFRVGCRTHTLHSSIARINYMKEWMAHAAGH